MKIASDAYEELYGVKPAIKAIHAGLECGLFLTKYPHLDMVSFGPTLRGVHSPSEKMHIPADVYKRQNINRVMSYLKHNYPTKQIIIMTPIHRAYAKFSAKNVQPDENYANAWGLYIDSYIDVLRQAASVWAVPLIDLYSESGLYPLEENHGQYFLSLIHI